MKFKVGHGFDVHRLEKGRKCVIGGVIIDSPVGPVGHSDGDVVIHALTDALLSACGFPDIGTMFPDNDPKWQNADSTIFLKTAFDEIRSSGFAIANVDITVITETPRLAQYYPQIKKRIAELLWIEEGSVGIKARSYEKVGPIGEGKVIEAHCVVLVYAI